MAYFSHRTLEPTYACSFFIFLKKKECDPQIEP
jgi:hypothetical protein